MTINNLGDQIRDYYHKQKLDEHRGDAILKLGRQFSSVYRFRRRCVVALSAAATIAITSYFAFHRDNRSINEIVSAEIAANHQQQLGPELRTSDYQELQTALVKLDFSIIPAKEFILKNFILTGGRYSTIYGETAVQLRLVSKTTGEPCFLHITKLNNLLEDIRPDTTVENRIHVQMWKSEGRFFAMSRMNVATP